MADLSVSPSSVAPLTGSQEVPPPRRRALGSVALGVVALYVGAGVMFLVMRALGPEVTPATPAAMPTHEGHDMSTMAATQDMAGMAGMPAMEPSPAGSESGVYISPARQQLIGVRTATVGREDVAEPIRAVGALAYDETRITQVHTKIAGWIDELFVDFAGKPIQKGQPLFTIYSPDLVATENEYLLARRAQRQLEASRFEETRQGATSLVAAARRRLALWDVPDAVIAELERTGEARRTVTVYAPSAGVVLERNAFGGQYVTPELALFKLADLSTVWVIGQVPEADAGRVQLGQSVTIELSNAPGTRPFRGRLTFIYPEVDPATRRVRVRVELPNPGLTLKPDTFVTLTIDAPPSNALAVPAEAVIDTGLQRYVILARDQGYFEPRVINTGAPAKGYYPVVSGLVAGDRVVTSAQFLIDSESNLQAAMQAMAGMPGMDMASHASGASDARR